MPCQSTTGAASAINKRCNDDEASTSTSHEYTICLLGDWAHLKATTMKSQSTDISASPSAVHEVPADFDTPVIQVSCGSGWISLLCEDGRAFSFGDNTYGQLGQSHDRPFVPVPIPISTPFCLLPRRRIIRLSCGSSHGGFVLDVGELYMFGCGAYGRLGTGKQENASTPTLITMKWSVLLAATPGTTHRKPQNSAVIDEDEDLVKSTDISCGDRHTLVLAIRTSRGNSDSRRTTTKSKTGIISFGDGMNGRLGLGDEKDRHEGVLLTTWLAASNVPGVGIAGNSGCMAPPTITTICAGSTHNLALSVTGDVFSWGNGVDGQLGHGTAVSEWVPRQLAFFKDLSISSISCGTSHSMAVARTGVVYTWGKGAEGQLGLDLEGDFTVNTVDGNVQVPHPVTILKGATQRVTIRSIVARNNVSLALDDRDRLFVWGDNALEQLGFPLSANTDQGTKSFLPRPRMRAYMDLHAPKSTTFSSQTISRAASLRGLVAAAKPEPIRLGLAHVEAGDRFTMLLFSTKPGISSSAAPGESRELASNVSPEISSEPKGTTISKWNFSLTEDLPISSIPSRESVFYRFMANYRVYMMPTMSKVRGDESDEDMERRSPRRRDRRGSTISKKNNILPTDPTVPGKSTNEGNSSACSSPAPVQGFDSWLNKRRNSPSKTNVTGTSFNNTHRFQSPAKQEIRGASSLETMQIRAPSLPMKPQKPKSGFRQNRSNRKLTAFISEPPGKTDPPSSNQNQSPSKNTPANPEKCSIR